MINKMGVMIRITNVLTSTIHKYHLNPTIGLRYLGNEQGGSKLCTANFVRYAVLAFTVHTYVGILCKHWEVAPE